MPYTPLHYPLAYLIYKSCKRFRVKLNFPAVIIGSFIPDLEIPFFWLTTGSKTYDRLVFHSIFGGGTLGTFTASLLTIYVYPWLFSKIFGLKPNAEMFKFSFTLVFSALIGVLSHVFLDTLNHPYNPLLFPFSTQTVNIFLLFQNPFIASVLVNLTCLAGLIFIVVFEARKNPKSFWKTLLLG